MHAWKVAAVISCCWIPMCGCNLCQHPCYDCGPAWTSDSCPSCNLDYRAGSILNRDASGRLVAEGEPGTSRRAGQIAEPGPTIVEPAPVAGERTKRLESPARTTSMAQLPQASRDVPAKRLTTTPPPATSAALSEAPMPPPKMVAAPPGTKEGAIHVLSVTDRRLDELQRRSKPVAIERKLPQPTEEKPVSDPGGWHPVEPRQQPAEAASQLREIER